MATTTEIFERLLNPLTDALSPEVAQRLLNLRRDPVVQQRVDYLADRCNEGLLTPEEREEYQTLVAAADLIAILQRKARTILST